VRYFEFTADGGKVISSEFVERKADIRRNQDFNCGTVLGWVGAP
jgi:hypothetical protein